MQSTPGPRHLGLVRSAFFVLAIALVGSTPFNSAVLGQGTDRPQVTRADYARAESVDRFHLIGKLKNGRVITHWIGQRDEFWYRRDTLAGYQFVRVDAATGHTTPAFDHVELARALARAAAVSIAADSIPVDRIGFGTARHAAADSVHAIVRGIGYDCLLRQTPVCVPDAAAPEGVLLSPDHRWGVIGRDGNLWLRDMKSGEERALTTDGEPDYGYGTYAYYSGFSAIPRERAVKAGHHLPPSGVSWSPDSRTLVAPRVDQRAVAAYPLLETVPADGSFRPKVHMVKIPLVGETDPVVDWTVFAIPSADLHHLQFPSGLAMGKVLWAPDNSHFYAIAQGDNQTTSALFDVNVATGNVREVLREHLVPHAALTSSVYNAPNVRVTKDGKHVIWWSERDGWGHLYLYDTATGKLENQITTGNWLVRDIVDVDELQHVIYFTAAGRESGNPYYRYLYHVNYDGSGLGLLSPEHADHMIDNQAASEYFSTTGTDILSPSGKYVVYDYSTPSQPTQTVIRSTADGHVVATVERADATALVAAGFVAPEEFEVKAADGKTPLWGVMYKPRDFDPSRRYPVIDAEYTSPITTIVPRNFTTAGPSLVMAGGAQALAELGSIVVLIDARGTPFRSRDFGEESFGRLDLMGLDDHVAAIRQLGERFQYVDTTRVGIIGVSFGGWGALRAMLDFPDFFKVGVAISPPGSMHGLYPSFYTLQGIPIYSDGSAIRPTPAEVPKNWALVDNRPQAGKLKGHLLITVSELDENVPPGSTFQFMDALMKANKDFDLLYLPDTPHGMGRYDAYGTRRIWDYFVRNLIGATPPGYRMHRK